MTDSSAYKITSVTDVWGKPRNDAIHQSLIGAHTRLSGTPRNGYSLMIDRPDGQISRTTAVRAVICEHGGKYVVKTLNSNYYLEPDDDDDTSYQPD